jgi:hypothetical protein
MTVFNQHSMGTAIYNLLSGTILTFRGKAPPNGTVPYAIVKFPDSEPEHYFGGNSYEFVRVKVCCWGTSLAQAHGVAGTVMTQLDYSDIGTGLYRRGSKEHSDEEDPHLHCVIINYDARFK